MEYICVCFHTDLSVFQKKRSQEGLSELFICEHGQVFFF